MVTVADCKPSISTLQVSPRFSGPTPAGRAGEDQVSR